MAHSILSLYFKESGTPRWESRIQGNDGVLSVVMQKSLILTHYERMIQCHKCQGIKPRKEIQELGKSTMQMSMAPIITTLAHKCCTDESTQTSAFSPTPTSVRDPF